MDLGQLTTAANTVYKELGAGYSESVYQNSLAHLLRSEHGLVVESEAQLEVRFRRVHVGACRCDLRVDGSLILEIKAVARLNDAHAAQLAAYLRCQTALDGGAPAEGYLINFGATGQGVELKRITSV